MKLFILLFYSSLSAIVFGHYPEFMTTPSSKLDQLCLMSENCVHDTIPVCGKMGDDTRSFLDLCDLMEYGCDHNQIYLHIDDIKGCPIVNNE